MTQEEMLERARLVSKLGWEASYQAHKRWLADWTFDQLASHYGFLCSRLPPCPPDLQPLQGPDSPPFRIDDDYIKWVRMYEAEVRAIEIELRRRWHN